MSYLVLARKYRPQTFEEVVAQEHVTQTLANAVRSGRVAHAILFSGPRGTAKTTIARILAKAMNCETGPTPVPCNQCRSCLEITAGHSPDVFEIDGASNNSVDQVRELRDNVKYMPSRSPYKIYIIDEVHMLSVAAFNALLKTLEEPPAHILFFFATTEPHKIPITILSRCQKYDLRRIATESIFNHLKSLCDREKFQAPDESLRLIAREAAGSMRDSLSLLDQVMACAQGELTHEQALDILGAFDTSVLVSVSDAAVRGDVPRLLTLVEELYNSGRDLKKFYGDMVRHFRDLLVVKVAGSAEALVDLSPDEIEQLRQRVAGTSVVHLEQMLDLISREETSIRLSTQPKLTMEMALVRLARLKPVLSIETLIERLDVLRKEIGERPLTAVSPVQFQDAAAVREEPPAYSPAAPTDAPSAPPSPPPQPERTAPPKGLPDTWHAILDRMARKHPSLAPHFTTSRLLKMDEKLLEIEVSGKPFNLSRVKQQRNVEILKKLCSRVVGRPVEVRIVENAIEVADTTEAKKKESEIRADAMGHPLVGDVMEVLGGKIVDVRVMEGQASGAGRQASGKE
jgi:DNA polymerase-3 subunit gamma/tau